jgi:hypothetical protein
VLGYEDFLKIPVNELYEKNKAMREERIKKEIEEAKQRELDYMANKPSEK